MPRLKNVDICTTSPFFQPNINQFNVSTQTVSVTLCFLKDKIGKQDFFSRL